MLTSVRHSMTRLAAAAGLALPELGAESGKGEVVESVREFLDQQRSGWGAKFGLVFEEIGLD